MLDQESGGTIVIMSSVTTIDWGSLNAAYLTSEHGLLGLNTHISRHYGARGIRCNCIFLRALEQKPNHDIHPDPNGRAARLEASISLGRLATPSDIALWVTF